MFGPYTIARKPSLGFISGANIVSKHGASDFARALRDFLLQDCRSSRFIPPADDLLSRSYAVYKKFKRDLPSLRGLKSDNHIDIVFAYPPIGRRPARYSTVLFLENPEVAENLGVRGMSSHSVFRHFVLTITQAIVLGKYARSFHSLPICSACAQTP